MDKETKDYVDKKVLKVTDDVTSSLENIKEKAKIFGENVEDFENLVDKKVQQAVYNKLDVKWQSFAVMVAIMAVLFVMHATAIYFIS